LLTEERYTESLSQDNIKAHHGLDTVVHTCNPSYSGDRSTLVVQGQPEQKHKTLSRKQIKNKRTVGVAQVVENLKIKKNNKSTSLF
jgi:hypothetical protein